MANDVLSNGRLQENTVVQRTRNDRSKRGIMNISIKGIYEYVYRYLFDSLQTSIKSSNSSMNDRSIFE